MRVDQLTGDSSASNLRYESGVASLIYEDYESEQRFRVRIATDCLYSEAPAETDSVHVRLIPLAEALSVDPASGRYTLPNDFGKQMATVRQGIHLALGRRSTEYPYFLQVRGYSIVLACPIRTVEAVEVIAE